ncbi:MAG: hypothetical protein DHS20C11_20520 [Lysobacteraceae bacterium]|nr:MAG: hypothetical protein DHS20C11_20520 [Xanthomonadaceae bacterium]
MSTNIMNNQDPSIAQALRDLPQLDCPQDQWQAIAAGLEKRKRRTVPASWVRSLSAVASLLLAVFISSVMPPQPNDTVEIQQLMAASQYYEQRVQLAPRVSRADRAMAAAEIEDLIASVDSQLVMASGRTQQRLLWQQRVALMSHLVSVTDPGAGFEQPRIL